MKSQIVISKTGRGGRRYRPYAFTEQGVAMLSSVLRSPRAVEVNIAIMLHFRAIAPAHGFESRPRPQDRGAGEQIRQFAVVFEAIKQLVSDDQAAKAQPKRRIGFNP